MKILATADQHLGKGLDLGRVPGERLSEQESVWRSTLALARDRGCDAIVHAGDLFDGRRPGPEIMLAAERPLVEHQEQGGCTVYLAAGNHDVPSQDGPCGLDVLAEAGLIELAREPRTWRVVAADGQEVVHVHALPWTPLSRLIAADGGDTPRDALAALASDLLLETARGLLAGTDLGPSILLGHWSVSQTSLPNGLDVGSLGGVVLPMDDLSALGYDALVFGHIHVYQHNGPFQYVGSPMPLDFGEPGDHGCTILTCHSSELVTHQFVRLPSRGFVTVTWQPSAPFESLDWRPLVDGAFVRLRYTATEEEARRVDHELIRRVLEDAGAYRVWIEPTVERARRERGEVLVDGQTRADQLAAYLEAIGVNGDVAPAMLARAAIYLEGSTT